MADFKSTKIQNSTGTVVNPATEDTLLSLKTLLTSIEGQQITSNQFELILGAIRATLNMPVYYNDSLNSLNVNATINSGTVTTVTTLANQTQIGGSNADLIVEENSIIAWSLANRNNFL